MGVKHYREGDVDASIVGPALMWEDTSNVLRPVSAAKPLPITTASSGYRTLKTISGTAAANGDNSLLAADAAKKWRIVAVTVQNESAVATTAILKLGATTIERVLGQNQGDGLSRVYPADARPVSALNEAIVLNLSGANQFGYTVHYIEET